MFWPEIQFTFWIRKFSLSFVAWALFAELVFIFQVYFCLSERITLVLQHCQLPWDTLICLQLFFSLGLQLFSSPEKAEAPSCYLIASFVSFILVHFSFRSLRILNIISGTGLLNNFIWSLRSHLVSRIHWSGGYYLSLLIMATEHKTIEGRLTKCPIYCRSHFILFGFSRKIPNFRSRPTVQPIN